MAAAMGRKRDICAKRKQRVTLRTLPSPGELFLVWQKSDRELLGIILSFSPFPCGLTDHKFTTIGSILIPLSVGTQGWLKINNLSFASCSLIFAGSFFLSALWCCCRYCCAALFGGDFLPLPPFIFLSSILWRRRNTSLGAAGDTAQGSSFSFIL